MDLKTLKELMTSDNIVLFGYTSNCGTCKMAEQMLDIVEQTVKNVQFIKVNLSVSSDIVKFYKIKSTPSFTLIKNKEVIDQFYAFHSVTHLYQKVGNLLENNV